MKDLKDKIIVFLLIVLSFVFGGSILPSIKNTNSSSAISNDDESQYLKNVNKKFTEIESKEDKILIYKLFSGAAQYLEASEFTGSTSQFDPLLGKVQSSYGWNREKYSSFTDAVSEYLISVKYDEPKNISSKSDRLAFAKIFKDLVGAVK